MRRNVLFAATAFAAVMAAAPASAATIVLNGDGFRIPPAADGTGPGQSSSTVTAGTGLGRISNIVLTLNNLRHTEVGDLQFLLRHRDVEVNFANFFAARQDSPTESDEADLNGDYRIFDAAALLFQSAPGDPIPSGDYRPNGNNQFTSFNGLFAAGDYTLTVRDRLATDSGRLGSWRLQITTDQVAAVPEPASWAMMIGGFGMAGGAMRSARRRQKVAFAI